MHCLKGEEKDRERKRGERGMGKQERHKGDEKEEIVEVKGGGGLNQFL